MNFYTLIFKKKLLNKKFVKIIIVSTFIIINFVALLNYYIDPLRMFQHSNVLNNKQVDFNERQQKTNYLYFNENSYKNVMLGSSRTTYLNEQHFYPDTFNYACNDMSPYEYEKFLEYFTYINKKEPEIIILGIDFFGTAIERNQRFEKQNYLKNTIEPYYRFKSLYNLKLAEYSIKNIRQNIKIRKPYYSRDNIKFIPEHYSIDNQEKINDTLVKFKNYKYDKNLKEYYMNLKKLYKNSKFIIFTTPVTVHQLNEYEQRDLMQNYLEWLTELIDIFGEVNHFAYSNEITNDLSYFFDAGHAKPKVSQHIADFVLENDVKLKDFGIKLTKDNFKYYKNSHQVR